jgi:uncharacterized membrane protein YkvA (DUF1232 family)
LEIVKLIREKTAYYQQLAFYERAPESAKILMLVAVIYLLSPIDLIPDFIPIIGFIDDLVIVPLLFWLAFKRIEAAKAEHIRQQRQEQAVGKTEMDHCQNDV